jgi:hypothetical protein
MQKILETLTSSNVKMVLIIIIITLVGLAVYKIINEIFNSPFGQGAGKVLDAAGQFAIGLENGCTKQSNCKTKTDETTCKNANGCGWGEKKGTCVNETGIAPGKGGFTDFGNCALGLAGLVYAIGQGLTFILGGIALIVGSKNKSLEQDSARTGHKYEDSLKEVVDKARSEFEQAKQDREANGEQPYSKEEASYDASIRTNKRATELAYRNAQAIEGSETYNNHIKQLTENYNAMKEELDNESELSDERREEINEGTGDDPVEPDERK